jgi:hypothetical protein
MLTESAVWLPVMNTAGGNGASKDNAPKNVFTKAKPRGGLRQVLLNNVYYLCTRLNLEVIPEIA